MKVSRPLQIGLGVWAVLCGAVGIYLAADWLIQLATCEPGVSCLGSKRDRTLTEDNAIEAIITCAFVAGVLWAIGAVPIIAVWKATEWIVASRRKSSHELRVEVAGWLAKLRAVWTRRGTLGKAAIVFVAVVIGLTIIGALLPGD